MSPTKTHLTKSIPDPLLPLQKPLKSLPHLARSFADCYHELALSSTSQFLPTPIRVLPTGEERGKFFAVDLGGTNLRVGVVELFGGGVLEIVRLPVSRGSWEIPEIMKTGAAEALFAWVVGRIVEVLEEVLGAGGGGVESVELGVTFSFPMDQSSHTSALLMPMGKGFTFTSTNDLSALLSAAWKKHISTTPLPLLNIISITNDSISTLLSAAYVHNGHSSKRSRAAAGIIAGTGTNATCLCPAWKLHPSKTIKEHSLPSPTAAMAAAAAVDTILLNTEWSINGTSHPLKPYMTSWDKHLDATNEKPGFQPLEEMIGGRYLGELVRLVSIDLFKPPSSSLLLLPETFSIPYGIETKLCAAVEEAESVEVVQKLLEGYFSNNEGGERDERVGEWKWTHSKAQTFQTICQKVSTRAAALLAAATIGVLQINDELSINPRREKLSNGHSTPGTADADVPYTNGHTHPKNTKQEEEEEEEGEEIIVSYTGTALEKYPHFVQRTQGFMDLIVDAWYNESATSSTGGGRKTVRLVEAKDGGIVGAAVLAAMVKEGKT